MGSCFSKKKVSFSSSSLPTEVVNPSKKNDVAAAAAAGKVVVQVKTEQQPNIKVVKQKEEESLAVPKKEKEEEQGLVKKEVFIIKHRKSHDRERPSLSPPQNEAAGADVAEVNVDLTSAVNNVNAVRTSSCTKEEVDAILIQCGRLSRSNSSGKAISSGRKYSGSKRSYDFDHENEPAVADHELKGEGNDEDELAERRLHRQRHRQSPSKGRRRTPSREREQQRSGSRERGSSSGGGRRVSRSPGRRSENTSNTSINTANANSSNIASKPAKMVSVPATVSSSLGMEKNNPDQGAIKRITVKRNVAAETAVASSRTAASPRSRSPARTNPKGCNDNQQQQPSLSRNPSRKAEHSPYRRNPLGEIDPSALRKSELSPYRRNPLSEIDTNSLQYPQSAGGINKKPNAEVNNRGGNNKGSIVDAKEQHRVEEGKTQPALTRSRSARRSRDLDINPETLLNPVPPTSYTNLLLEDIQNFHQKNTVAASSFSLPACVSKACSILEAVADLNSTTSSNLSVGRTMGEGKDPFVDLMEPSFHKYVTVKRGEDMEEQESSGSNSFVSSGQQWGFSSSSWEPNSVESADRRSREEDGSTSRERNGIGRGRVTPMVAAATST
ncbi:hypothetical protein SLA2020_036340 [Shorea laevis]